ncbi:MAG: AsmA-like C-terminal domain-containing protein [Proteobacteria bacterium]|nr:AsmA-like C-terminal domain-containing protein [Pseudomonadota bacterium]
MLLFFAAALVGLALIFGVLIWQLSRGPISLSFLTPLIERALDTGHGNARIRLHDTILTWAADERELDIRAVGLQFVDSSDSVRATIPEMSIKFSGRALLRGLVAPTSLELFGPRVRVVREVNGDISMDIGNSPAADGSSATSPGLIEELLKTPNPDRASGYLTRVAVRSALIEFDDFQRGMHLSTPRANIALLRDAEGISAEGSVVFGELGRAIRADLSGIYRAESGATELGLVFSDVSPATLAAFAPELEPLAQLDAKLEGTLTLSLDSNLEPSGMSVDVRAGAGHVVLDSLFEEPVAFDSGSFRMRSEQGFDAFVLESGILELGATTILLNGNARHVLDQWNLVVIAEVHDLPVNSIETYWPREIEPSARSWITENLKDGHVDSAILRVRANVPETDPGSVDIVDFDGEIRFRETAVHYLRPLPPVRDVFGVARFDTRNFTVDLGGGTLRDLVAESGRVEILGLDGPPRGESIKIEVTISGPVRDALEILDSEPLEFISGFGLDPERTSGSHRTNAVFAFPLLDDVLIDQIAVATASRMVDFGAEDAVFGLPVSKGDLALKVNRDGMEVSGTAAIGSVPIGLTWRERFEEGDAVRTLYKVRANLDDDARAEFGLDGIPFVSGPAGLGLTYAIGWDGAAVGAAEIDLTDLTVDMDPFGWTKMPGEEGRAFVRFLVQNEVLTSMPELSVRAGDLEIDGAGLFRSGIDGPELQRLTLERLVFGETDAFVNIELPKGVPQLISVGGASLDLRSVMENLFEESDEKDKEDSAMQIVISEQSPVAEIRLGEETSLLGAFGTFFNDGNDWSDVELRGRLSNGGRIYLRVEPEGEARSVNFESDNAGAVLSALDWIDTIRGGEMRVRGQMSGSGDNAVITGQLDMQNFVLTEGPIGAQILALTSFSGIADVLGGQGLTFRRVEVPFTLTDKEITIREGKARGADIGVLASGRIDRETDALELTGEIAPAYTLNSLLANIPLIGAVLSGGADGIFAATFRVGGTLDDPDVSVNPLSVLTPGIVRRLLTGFGREDSPGADNDEELEPAPDEGR